MLAVCLVSCVCPRSFRACFICGVGSKKGSLGRLGDDVVWWAGCARWWAGAALAYIYIVSVMVCRLNNYLNCTNLTDV
jgi:hypothetical protein